MKSRSTLLAWRIAGAALLSLAPLVLMLSRVQGFGLRDNADLFALTLASPILIAYPIALCLLAAGPLSQAVETRWIANARTRLDARRFVLSELVKAAALGAVVGLAIVWTTGVTSFVLWPLIGNPSIDPAGYFLTTEQAIIDSYSRFTYSEWLAGGYWSFLAAYGGVVAMAGASFSVLAVATTLFARNAYVGSILPGVFAVLATIIAAILGRPQAGIIYSIFPFGLDQTPWFEGALPAISWAVAAIVASLFVVLRSPMLPSLR